MANTKIQSEQIEDDIALGGNPTTTTQSAGNNTTRVATTAFVTTAVANLVDSAPSALDTLNELAAAMGDDASFSTTITNSIATKLPLAGGTMTGNIAHASDFTIDAGGDITLDADGADIILKDGGTSFAELDKDNNNFRIKNPIADGDIKIQGVDGSSTITALDFDMSAAGAATFNAGGVFNDDVSVFGSDSKLFVGESGAGGTFGFLAWNDSSNYLYLGNSYNSAFNTDLVIDSSGNIGIGLTSSIASALHVNPEISLGADSNNRGIINYSNNILSFGTRQSSTNYFSTVNITSGKIGFGGVPLTDYHFYVRDASESVFVTDQRAYSVSGRGGHLAFGGIYNSSSSTTSWAGIKGLAESTSDGNYAGSLAFFTRPNGGASTERMRINSSGTVLVGTSTINPQSASSGNNEGCMFGVGLITAGRAGGEIAIFNRQSSDGDILLFRKDGTTVGQMAAKDGDVTVGTGDTGFRFVDGSDAITPHNISSNAGRDDAIDLGTSGARFKNLRLSGNVILHSGNGIDFSATGDSAGSMGSELLDDYEEGTWTPTLPNGGTLTNVGSNYTKIGRMVHLTSYLQTIAPTNNSSAFLIGGLPFTVWASGYTYSAGSFSYIGTSSGNVNRFGLLASTGNSYLYFHYIDGTGGSGVTNAQWISEMGSGTGIHLIFHATFYTAS